MGLGTALSIGGSVLGAMGDKKKGAQQQQLSAFDSLPQEVKDIWLKSYIPAVQTQFDKPYEAVPMKRYNEDLASPFASRGMAELQAYSDSKGGLFTPYGKGSESGGATDAAAQKAAMDKQMEAMREEMMGRDYAMNTKNLGIQKSASLGQGSTADDYRALARMMAADNASSPAGRNLGLKNELDLSDLDIKNAYLSQFKGKK
jgi:hypothetical protein